MIKLLKRAHPYKWKILIVVFLLLVQALSDLYLPTLMSDIIDKGVVKEDINFIIITGLYMLGIALIGGVARTYASYQVARISTGFGKDLRSGIFSKITSFSLNETDRFGTATLITRTTNDVTQVQNAMMQILVFFSRAPMMAIGSIIMALRKDVPLTYVILGSVLLMGVFIAILATKAIPLFKVMQEKVDSLNLVVRERLTGIRVIRAFNRTAYENKKFDHANSDLRDVNIEVNRLMALMSPFMMLFFNITSILLVWFGAKRIDLGTMQVGDMMAFLQYAMQLMFSVLMLTMAFILVPRASASAIRINEILDTDPEIKSPDKAKNIPAGDIELEFRNVSFKYHQDKAATLPAIDNVSFTAGKGELTAIVGGTGSGKTTLLNLIPRFYDATEGEILINGINIKDVSLRDLRSKLGYAPQRSVLFSGSVTENLSFGNRDASADEVKEASRVAMANDFIEKMDEGYDSTISQGGTNVSGGQKQRITIARTIVKNPEIYLFDDSFSALDYKTESMLRSELRKKTKNATVLVVAQRVSTVMDADRIIVLDEGKVAGIGTHSSLLETSEVYREIVYSQLSREEIS